MLGQRDEEARDRLFRFEPLLAGGDPENGRAVFFGNKVACSTCHSIGNDGAKVGPDLTKVGAIRSGRDILESILLPSASFAQGFESDRVTTAGGEELSGILVRQTADAVLLRSASGTDVQLWRNQGVPPNRLERSQRLRVRKARTPQYFNRSEPGNRVRLRAQLLD